MVTSHFPTIRYEGQEFDQFSHVFRFLPHPPLSALNFSGQNLKNCVTLGKLLTIN